MKRTIAAVLLGGVVAALLSAIGPKPQFTADGYDYAIMMLMDRGLPYAAAQTQATRFYATQPVMRKAEAFHPWLGKRPEYWSLFSVRTVYPWVASLLYPVRGFNALIDVSRLSYVAVAMLLVLLSLRFAPLPYGVLLAVALSLFPPWRDLGRDALTDALAVAFSTATLLAAIACLDRRTWPRLVLFAALCGLLTFTRPIVYIVLGAGILAGIAAPRNGDRSRLGTAAWLTGIAALWGVAIEMAVAHAHVPSFRWIVADTYHHYLMRGYAPAGESLRAFFLHEELAIAEHAIVKGALSIVPVLAMLGIYLRRRDPATSLLTGACAATWMGAILDPDRFDVIRCIVMPVAPAMAALAAASVATAATRVPALLGLSTLRVRHLLTRRVLARSHTVKE